MTMTTGASEKIKLKPPTPFTGKWNEFVLFLQDIYIYRSNHTTNRW
jgi:hypothetical protein